MPFTIVRQDITHMQVDAIVNAANPGLVMGGGVCGAIFQAAGPDKLQRACSKIAPIKTGEAATISRRSLSSMPPAPYTAKGLPGRTNAYSAPLTWHPSSWR